MFSLNPRDVELTLAERGVIVTHGSVRHWCQKFGAVFVFAHRLRRRRPAPVDTCHSDEVFMRVHGVVHCLGDGRTRAVLCSIFWCCHYLFEAEFCNRAAGWEKGQVEKNVQHARPRVWNDTPRAANLDAFNAWLEVRSRDVWAQDPSAVFSAPLA